MTADKNISTDTEKKGIAHSGQAVNSVEQAKAGSPSETPVKEGYKHTKLGWIPEEWGLIKLGNRVKKVGSGKTPKGGQSVYKTSGRPLVRSQNVGWGTLMLEDVAFIDDEIHGTFKSTELKENDVLLNITGASIGRCALTTKEIIGGNVNQHVCIIRAFDSIEPSYLVYYFLSSRGQNQIDSFQAGGNRQGLNFEQIRSFPIPLPPLPEQQKIAQILSTWDRAITKTEALIKQKQKRKKGLMQQLLTGKKRFMEFVKSDKMKETKLGEIPEDWEEMNLKDLSKIVRGSSPRPAGDPKYFNGDYIPWLTVAALTNISDSKIFVNTTYSFLTQEGMKQSRVLDKGTLILANSGATLGIAKVLSIRCCANDGIAAFLNISEHVDKYYLYYFLNSKTKFYREVIAPGNGQPNLNTDLIGLTKIQLPLFNEQQKIASVLSTADKEINYLQVQLDQLKEQKKGLMQKLLTGEVRVKIDKI